MLADRATRQLVQESRIGPFRLKPWVRNGRQLEAILFERRPDRDAEQKASAIKAAFNTRQMFAVKLQHADGTIEDLDASSSEEFQHEMARKVAEYLRVPLVVQEQRPGANA